LVSVTMTLPQSRIEFDETVESIQDVEQLKPDPGHTANASAASELSSCSSDLHDDVEHDDVEKVHSGEIMLALTQEFSEGKSQKRNAPPGTSISSWELGAEVLNFNRTFLPPDAFYFHDVVYATRDALEDALDTEIVETVILEFLVVDPRFFVVNIPDFGHVPALWYRWAQQFVMRPGRHGWEALCEAPATAVLRSGALSKCTEE